MPQVDEDQKVRVNMPESKHHGQVGLVMTTDDDPRKFNAYVVWVDGSGGAWFKYSEVEPA